MKRQQSGFTLIELVMVIVIIGVLAAFALPRFANLTGDAKAATLNGAAGSMHSAAAIAHSVFLAEAKGPTDPITLEGQSVAMSNGYPSEVGILVAANIATNDYSINDAANAPAANSVTITAKNATTPTGCTFSYTAAASASAAPTFTVPSIGGC